MVDDVRKADNMLGETKSTHKESLNEAEIKRPSSSTELDESHAASAFVVVALVDALKKFEGSNHMGLLLLIVFFLAEPLIYYKIYMWASGHGMEWVG